MPDILSLASYSADRWLPAGGGRTLLSAVDGSTVAVMPADGAEILHHARTIGAPRSIA